MPWILSHSGLKRKFPRKFPILEFLLWKGNFPGGLGGCVLYWNWFSWWRINLLYFFLWVSDIYLGIVKMRMSHLHEKCRIGRVKQREQGIFIISFSSATNQGMLKLQLNTQRRQSAWIVILSQLLSAWIVRYFWDACLTQWNTQAVLQCNDTYNTPICVCWCQ